MRVFIQAKVLFLLRLVVYALDVIVVLTHSDLALLLNDLWQTVYNFTACVLVIDGLETEQVSHSYQQSGDFIIAVDPFPVV